MHNTQNKYLENGIEILDVYNMMDPDYEREQDKCGVRKSHMVEIVVKSFVGYGDVKGRGNFYLKFEKKNSAQNMAFLSASMRVCQNIGVNVYGFKSII